MCERPVFIIGDKVGREEAVKEGECAAFAFTCAK
jgi:hypothetical protein